VSFGLVFGETLAPSRYRIAVLTKDLKKPHAGSWCPAASLAQALWDSLQGSGGPLPRPGLCASKSNVGERLEGHTYQTRFASCSLGTVNKPLILLSQTKEHHIWPLSTSIFASSTSACVTLNHLQYGSPLLPQAHPNPGRLHHLFWAVRRPDCGQNQEVLPSPAYAAASHLRCLPSSIFICKATLLNHSASTRACTNLVQTSA
jgi:hypothetical protein